MSFIVSGVEKVYHTIRKYQITGVKVDKSSLLNQLSFMTGLEIFMVRAQKHTRRIIENDSNDQTSDKLYPEQHQI